MVKSLPSDPTHCAVGREVFAPAAGAGQGPHPCCFCSSFSPVTLD